MLFVLLNDVRFCAFLFSVCIVRCFSDSFALVSSKFLEADGWGMDGWFLLVSVTIFAFCLGCLLVGANKVFYLLSAI